MIPGTVLHNSVDIIEIFHLTLNNYCVFRTTVENVKLALRPLPDEASSGTGPTVNVIIFFQSKNRGY